MPQRALPMALNGCYYRVSSGCISRLATGFSGRTHGQKIALGLRPRAIFYPWVLPLKSLLPRAICCLRGRPCSSNHFGAISSALYGILLTGKKSHDNSVLSLFAFQVSSARRRSARRRRPSRSGRRCRRAAPGRPSSRSPRWQTPGSFRYSSQSVFVLYPPHPMNTMEMNVGRRSIS